MLLYMHMYKICGLTTYKNTTLLHDSKEKCKGSDAKCMTVSQFIKLGHITWVCQMILFQLLADIVQNILISTISKFFVSLFVNQ